MDWIGIVGGAVGGAFGGAIGWLLVAKYGKRDQRVRTVLMVLPVVLLGSFARQIAETPAVRDSISPPSRMDRMSRKYGALYDSPAFKAKIAGRDPQEARAVARDMAHAGLRRLPIADLETWNRLRLVLAGLSPGLCAGFWTGRVDPSELQASIEKLSDADFEGWVDLSMKAGQLELEGKTAAPGRPHSMEQTIQLVLARLPGTEAERFRKGALQGTSLEDSEACWSVKAVLKITGQLDPDNRELALRSLSEL
jgi:hypothetical protein